MSAYDNDFESIYDACIKLADTIVVKSDDTARLINVPIALRMQINQNDKTTWKYYMNLAGRYHATDTMMIVKSIDTLEDIEFTIENLRIHRATARNYAYGTDYYKRLVAKYPTQRRLIHGVLYPVDINVAVAAKNGAILTYPADLVEDQEMQLIPELQKWIDGYLARYVNPKFNISDELYLTVAWGMLWILMIPPIYNIRLAASKTPQAHSYHIKQHLLSHGFTSDQIDALTLKQKMHFYRNIAYIERNNGRVEIFDGLVQHTMTERNLPLAEYTMRHDLSEQPTSLRPTVFFKRTDVGLPTTAVVPDSINLQQILDKEDGLARDNAQQKGEIITDVQYLMENSPSNVLKTKVLESAMVDYTGSTPITMEDVLINHWLFYSSKGIYNAFIQIQNPVSGDNIPLSAKDAVVFWCYAWCVYHDVPIEIVPQLVAERVQRIPLPMPADLMKVAVKGYVDPEIAVELLSMQPSVGKLVSIDSFYSFCQEIYNAAQMQRMVVARQEHQFSRGLVENMVHQIYSDNSCAFAPEGTYFKDWFAARNININDFNKEQMGQVFSFITAAATGLNLHITNSVANLQRSMVRLMTQLSSYSVQFLSQINDSALLPLDYPITRVGDYDGGTEEEFWLEILTTGVSSAVFWHAFSFYTGYAWPTMGDDWTHKHAQEFTVEIPVNFLDKSVQRVSNIDINIGKVGFDVDYDEITPNDRDIINVPGIKDYLALPLKDQQGFRDAAGNYWWPEIPQEPTLSEKTPRRQLDGFEWDPQEPQ